MSLSFWLRDYLYKPLGGNRHGRLKTYRNLLVTMLLGGIWHGAGWKFVMWGALHGGGLAIERMLEPQIGRRPTSLAGQVAGTVLVFHFVCLAWIFFRAEDFSVAWLYLCGLGSGWTAGLQQAQPFTVALILLGLAGQFTSPAFLERSADGARASAELGSGIARRDCCCGDQCRRAGRHRTLHLFPVLSHGRLRKSSTSGGIACEQRRRDPAGRKAAHRITRSGLGGLRLWRRWRWPC